MPVMDGIELIKHLKSVETTNDIPIIMCTGVMTKTENLKTALDAGAVDYIRKPVEKLELTARVHSMLKLSDSMKKIKEQNIDLVLQREEILQQKEEILAQNENLEQANIEITDQKNEIEKSHKNITASINYAKRIQTAVLTLPDIISMLLPDHFIFFEPCNVVSGDFYYLKQVRNFTIVAAADCTGHGVPGAFMSMLSIALLNEIVLNKELTNANLVLDELRIQIKKLLQQTGDENDQEDGLDIAFCMINIETMELSFSGAFNPLWLFRSKNETDTPFEFIELAATPQPVGIYRKERPFTEQKIQLEKNDVFYVFSDGYVSQFGSDKNQTFKTIRLKTLLSEIFQKPLDEQKQIISQTFYNWKGSYNQTDDVLVMGVRI